MKLDLVKLIFTGLFIITTHSYIKAAHKKTLADGYEIKVKLTEYAKDTLFLGYQLGDKSYIKDTAIINKQTGLFTFKGEKKLASGIYLLIMPPEHTYFQIMVSDKEQRFSLTASAVDFYRDAKLTGAPDNAIFFSYMTYLADKRKEADAILATRAKDSVAAQKKLENLDKEVKTYQLDIAKKHAGTVSSMLIKSAIEIDIPKFEEIKDPAERNYAMYLHYKKHYFDNFEMGNPAMLRSPVLNSRIQYYIDKLTPEHPDSIAVALDHLLEMLRPSSESFQHYFVQFLNTYAKSKLVGFDAIYVHLAKKYIETGQCDGFIDKENRDKIVDNANRLFPILIGKKAPEIKVFKEDNSRVSLYDVKAKYTVLFIYDPECGHCQKQSPKLVEFLQKMKDKKVDVKVITLCSRMNDKLADCWKYAKEKGFGEFINTVDPYLISRYKTLYNVETTPQVFVLDENKVIRSKNIEAQQLEEVIDYLINDENQKLKNTLKNN